MLYLWGKYYKEDFSGEEKLATTDNKINVNILVNNQ